MKLMLIVIFLWFASPVSSHVLARLETATNEKLDEHCEIYEDISELERELATRSEDKTAETEKETEAPLS